MWWEGIELETLIKWDDNYLPTAQLKGTEIGRLLSPCVYGWQRGNEWLYIGFSEHGLARVFTSNHHVFNTYKMWETDVIYLWQPEGKTIEQLKSLEQTLIIVLEPRYNKTMTKQINMKKHDRFLKGAKRRAENKKLKTLTLAKELLEE